MSKEVSEITLDEARRACARFARCVSSCCKCSHFDECKTKDAPLSRLGRYVAHIERLCEKARLLLPSTSKWQGEVRPVPASLEDDPAILVKLAVKLPKIRRKEYIYLTGAESDYEVMRQIFKVWRYMVLENQNAIVEV